MPAVFTELLSEVQTPTAANILLAILALAGPFLGPNMLVPLTNISSLGFIIGCFMVSCACLKMRYTEPDLHRPYTVPLGRVGMRPGHPGLCNDHRAARASVQPGGPEYTGVDHRGRLGSLGPALHGQQARQPSRATGTVEAAD